MRTRKGWPCCASLRTSAADASFRPPGLTTHGLTTHGLTTHGLTRRAESV
ncbi:hypothetical protein TSH58p_08795 [Azospirillum sp. TSH58]|nr:hypothetical protein TSH58p_08795 [Azospirillum sp. TSH58]